ncbi:MAG: phosphoribosylformylglycinamidine cyclo-ligase [Burkholderiales bacterium]|nr:MAG: phosphoribosylformylglycinamidine cyclo-ligase [Burkholderiales bacterium]
MTQQPSAPKREPLTYRQAGVDYGRIDPLKIRAQQAAAATAGNLARLGLAEVGASRGESAYVVDCGEFYLASITECLGTKALVADQMRAVTGRTYYDRIAQDTLAMAINDIITVGATPVSVHAYWATGGSDWFDDEARARALIDGWKAACDACGVAWGGGETPALAGVVAPGRIDLAASCVGLVRPKSRLTLGEKLAAGDVIVLLESNGIHANGVTLARRLAERIAGGFGAEMEGGQLYGEALLAPTVLYSPVTEALAAAGILPHYCANVTGHGWRKLMRHPASFSYRIHTLPPVPPVLRFIEKHAAIDAREAYGNLNMGAGFALYLAAAEAARALEIAASVGVRGWIAGTVEAGDKRVLIEPLGLTFAADDLHVRA